MKNCPSTALWTISLKSIKSKKIFHFQSDLITCIWWILKNLFLATILSLLVGCHIFSHLMEIPLWLTVPRKTNFSIFVVSSTELKLMQNIIFVRSTRKEVNSPITASNYLAMSFQLTSKKRSMKKENTLTTSQSQALWPVSYGTRTQKELPFMWILENCSKCLCCV